MQYSSVMGLARGSLFTSINILMIGIAALSIFLISLMQYDSFFVISAQISFYLATTEG